MASTATKMLDVARSQLGYVEHPGNRTKYGVWFGADGNAWCDMFVSWCAHTAGAGDIVGKASYTPAHAQWFQARKQWGHTPKVGAIVFFQWPGMNRIAHVGIVEAIRPDGSIVTIEGNTDEAGGRTGGKVMRKVRRANIAGYGYPAYLSTGVQKAPVKAPAKAPAKASPRPVIRRNSQGQAVKNAQSALIKKGYKIALTERLKAVFGPTTYAAVVAIQKKHGLKPDGVVGVDTWKVIAS